jgi:MinD-like ATPase involved in chromosome partitioning or flagellar assembly
MEATAAMADHSLALPEAGDAWVMPGLQSAAQAATLSGGAWGRLAQGVERVPSVLSRDVLVDAGRLGEGSCWPVIAACELVLLVVRPTARSVQGARAASELLRQRLGDLDAVQLVVNGAGPYRPADVAAALALEPVYEIPSDPRAAAALVDGSVATVRGLARSKLVRAAGQVSEQIARREDFTAVGS